MVGLLAGMLAAAAAALGCAALVTRVDRTVAALAGPGRRSPSPPGVRRIVASLGRWPPLSRLARPERIGERLARSGRDLSVAEVVGLKAAGALAVGALCLVGPTGLRLLLPLAMAGAFLGPDVLLARAARRRSRRADSSVPELLDLLAAGSAAGLAAPLAMRRAVGALDGPLAEELRLVLRAVDLGGRWREELRGMAERLDLRDLRRVVAAVTRTERLGTSLAPALRDLAAEVRDVRRARAAERARKAPVKMLFPLVFLVLPAFLLLTVAPVLLVTVRSIR